MYQTKLIKKEMVADSTLAVHLEKPEGFSFKAGQSIDLAIESPSETDDLGSVRTFSIASAPHEKEIVVATRLRDTAFKRELQNLEIDAQNLSIDGPFGDMTLPTRTDRTLMLLAGGIGVTPFISMIRHAVFEKTPHRITLLYSFKNPDSAAYLDELIEITKENENITVLPTVTGTQSSGKWSGRTGRIDDKLLHDTNESISNSLFYLAGPPTFIRAMQDLLEGEGVLDDDIKVEEFAGY